MLLGGSEEPLIEPNLKERGEGESEKKMFDPNEPAPATSAMLTLFLKISTPAIFTNILNFIASAMTIALAGHMNDPSKLAAQGLSTTVMTIMISSFLVGLNAA